MKLFRIALAALVLSLVSLASLPGTAQATTVNLDFEEASGSAVHVGDDGPLSSTGGTLWNQVVSGTDTVALLDEFAATTDVNIRFGSFSAGQTFTDLGINDLQNSGVLGTFDLYGLDANTLYDLAVYVGEGGGFILTHATGSNGFFVADPGADGWSLPGTLSVANGARGDYYLIRDLAPADLGGGDFGFAFSTDGAVTGIQLVVPEPSSMLLVSLGVIGLAAKRRGVRG